MEMENFKAEICQKHCFFNDEQADRWTEGRTERPTNGRTRHHHHWAVSTVMASAKLKTVRELWRTQVETLGKHIQVMELIIRVYRLIG